MFKSKLPESALFCNLLSLWVQPNASLDLPAPSHCHFYMGAGMLQCFEAACGSLALISTPDGTREVAQEWKCSGVSSNTSPHGSGRQQGAPGGILGVPWAGPGAGLDEPDGLPPTLYSMVLWLINIINNHPLRVQTMGSQLKGNIFL